MRRAGGGRGHRDGLAKQHLNLARAASSQLSEGDGVCMCVYFSVSEYQRVRVVACLCLRACVLYVSKHFCRSEAAGGTVVSEAPAPGDEADRIKTHHNTAVHSPDNTLRALCAPETLFAAIRGEDHLPC